MKSESCNSLIVIHAFRIERFTSAQLSFYNFLKNFVSRYFTYFQYSRKVSFWLPVECWMCDSFLYTDQRTIVALYVIFSFLFSFFQVLTLSCKYTLFFIRTSNLEAEDERFLRSEAENVLKMFINSYGILCIA